MSENENTETCVECGHTFPENKITVIDGRYVCDECYSSHYVECVECDSIVHINESESTVRGSVCESCYEQYYFLCDCCEEVYPDSRYAENDLCEDCCGGNECNEEDENGLYSYSYKPTPIFYGTGDLFFGIELEIESKDNPKPNDIWDAVQLLPKFVYAKKDSSIYNGFEVVSHPTSWEWLQANKNLWDKVLDLRNNGFLSYKTNTCGMHVHLSKKAFSTLHLYKFLKMFFENQEFITTISRRRKNKLDRWASLHSDESIIYKAKNKTNTVRHTAVNLQNTPTVEIRIFRGTLSPIGFWRNVEFCKAAYEFTKIASIKDITTNGFCKYVVENKKEYPNLEQFMLNKGLIDSLFNAKDK